MVSAPVVGSALRGLVLAHGFASVQDSRRAPTLGGGAAARAGELRQIMEGWLFVHCH